MACMEYENGHSIGEHEDMEHMAFEPIKKGEACKHAKHAHKQEHKARAKHMCTRA